MNIKLLFIHAVLGRQQLIGPILQDYLRKTVADRKQLAQFTASLPPDAPIDESGHADAVRDQMNVYNCKLKIYFSKVP